MKNAPSENERFERAWSRRTAAKNVVGALAIAAIMMASIGFGAVALVAAHAPSGTGIPGITLGPISKGNSYNWAGYGDAAATGSVTQVSAAWFIPTTTCSGPNSAGVGYDAQWIGIDGLNNGNVSQVGTLAYCPSHLATPTYYLWWEFYPYNGVQLVTTASAGDAIEAWVTYDPTFCIGTTCGTFSLNLVDLSSGATVSETGAAWVCSSSGCEGGPAATAECISEDILPYQLEKFSQMTFYNCMATIGSSYKGIGGFSSTMATTYQLTQYGLTSGLKDQTVGTLFTQYYPRSSFTVNFHHSD